MKKISITSHKQILLFIVWTTLGIVSTVGFFIYQPYIGDITDYSIRQSGYNFINPLLECEIQSNWDRQKYIPFETETINRIKKEVIETHSGMTIGIYVRNLNNGPWFGINEDEKYSPASLMKVPILITFLKWIESDPNILTRKILVNDDENGSTQYFKPAKKLIIGKEYTVKELLEQMIIYSDNSAMNILANIMPIDFLY